MKKKDCAEVVYLIGSRKRMLELIRKKVAEDDEMCSLVSRSAQWDYKLEKMVRAEWGDL